MILLLIRFVTDLLQKCIGLINLKDGEDAIYFLSQSVANLKVFCFPEDIYFT